MRAKSVGNLTCRLANKKHDKKHAGPSSNQLGPIEITNKKVFLVFLNFILTPH